jgi:hypothetical protein
VLGVVSSRAGRYLLVPASGCDDVPRRDQRGQLPDSAAGAAAFVREEPEDVDVAIVEGASARVRPLVMTVATTVLGLLPLLWEAGVGADVLARTAAPVVGGLWSCMLLTLLVLPAAYAMWRRHQVRRSLAIETLAIETPDGRPARPPQYSANASSG